MEKLCTTMIRAIDAHQAFESYAGNAHGRRGLRITSEYGLFREALELRNGQTLLGSRVISLPRGCRLVGQQTGLRQLRFRQNVQMDGIQTDRLHGVQGSAQKIRKRM